MQTQYARSCASGVRGSMFIWTGIAWVEQRQEKLNARKARFGITDNKPPAVAGAGKGGAAKPAAASELEAKKKARAERFGLTAADAKGSVAKRFAPPQQKGVDAMSEAAKKKVWRKHAPCLSTLVCRGACFAGWLPCSFRGPTPGVGSSLKQRPLHL
jgi:hypothetical protein